MQRTSMMALALATLIAPACKINGKDILSRPGGGSSSGSSGSSSSSSSSGSSSGGGDSSDHDAGGGDGGGGGATASGGGGGGDICKPLEDAGFDENVRRQDIAEHTTICDVVTIDPAPGVKKVGARKPGWCGEVAKLMPEGARTSWAHGPMSQIKEGRYWWDQTTLVLGALCVNPDDARVQEQTGYLYQYWVNQTGLTPEQLDGLFKYMGSYPAHETTLYADTMKAACKAFPAISSEASAHDKLLGEAVRSSLGCADRSGAPYWVSGGSSDDISWYVDAAAEPPSELLRSYVVMRCLGQPDEIGGQELAAYAVCGTDARALDAAKLEQEIAGYHELAKAHARTQHAIARKIAARYEAVARDKVKEDPAWQVLLYDAPAAAWKAWKADYKANQKVIDAERDYEALYFGPSRKAAKNCWAAPWRNLTAHVGAAKARSVLDAKHAMTDRIGTIILEHLVACADAEGMAQVHNAYGTVFASARPVRGPRFATFFAVIDALNEIKADRSKFPAEVSWFSRMFTGRSPVVSTGGSSLDSLDLAGSDKGGVVKSVKKSDGGLIVEFKTERWKDSTWDCKSTGEIIMFHSDGTPIYGQDCKYAGEEWVSQTHDPIWVDELMGAGIKPGAFVRSTSGAARHGNVFDAMPVEVWASKDKKQLVAYLGLEL
ncbi:MAG: hypothetical protein KC464_04655 [Myxococcales bacterium]|nr:hypothetical protein [Myxococcales bacterium]